MRVQIESKRLVLTPETKLEELALEALLNSWNERSLATDAQPAQGSKYIAPSIATADPLGLRSGYTTAAGSTGGSQDVQR